MGKYTFTFYDLRIFLLFLVIFLLLPFPVTATEEGTVSPDEIVLYAVIPGGADESVQELEAKTILSLAVEDMNSYYRDIGSDLIVSLNITECTPEPESVLAAVKQLHESGVHMILGYLTSAQLTAIKPYVDANDLLILSSGGSATSLSIPGDNILRFNPDDSSQELALNYILDQSNITEIVPLVRDDLWGNFVNLTIRENRMKHTNLDDLVRYDPESTVYEDIVSRLDQQVGRVLEQEDKNSVGILALSFSEIVPILEEASNEKYGNLSLVRWFGTDMNAVNPDKVRSQSGLAYGSERIFTGYTLYQTNLKSDERVIRKIGYDPNGLAYALYDMAKIAAQALSLHGSDKAKDLNTAVTAISSQYFSRLGPMKLNAAGDRETAYYTIWRLEKDTDGKVVSKILGAVLKLDNQTSPILLKMVDGELSFNSIS